MRMLTGLVAFWLVLSCNTREKADLIVHNATVYSIDSSFGIFEAVAVKDGKILATGSNSVILE